MGHTPAAPRFPSTDTPSVRRRRHPGLRRAGYVLAGALVAFVVAASFASSGSATPRTAAFWSTYCTGHPHTANRHCVLTAPTGLTATRVTASGATLAWKRVRGASGYAVFAGGSVLDTTSATSMTDTSSAAGSTTAFSVATMNPAGQSPPGAGYQVTTLPASPTGVVATPGDGDIHLVWTAVHGATSYTVLSGGAPVMTTATPSATIPDLVDGTTYSLSVVATDSSGDSSPSAVILVAPVLPLPASPVALAASAVTASGATLTWDPVVGATGYQVDAQGLPIGAVTTATFTDTTAASGSSVTYTVAAIDPSGTGPASGVDVLTLPAAPDAATSSSVTASGATLTWDPVVGADDYLVAADGSLIASVTGTDYTDGSASGGTSVAYTIVAVDASGAGAPSTPTTVVTLPDAPNALAASAVTGVGATLTWDPVAGATDYVVYAQGVAVATLTQTDFVDTTAVSGTTVAYTVAAADGSGTGAPAGPVTVVIIPAAPTDLATSDVTTSGATFTWDPVVGATGYQVASAGTVLATTSSPTWTDTSEVPGSTVPFTVVATDSSGTGPAAGIELVTLPAAPGPVVTSSVSSGGATLAWGPVAGATSYLVSVDGTRSVTVGVPTYTDASSPSGVAVTYTVAAVDVSGPGGPSDPVGIVTLPAAPTGLTATAVTGPAVTLAWSPVVGATRYTVYGGGTPILGTTDTTASDTGESPGATVSYTVTAWDATGESAVSAVAQVVLVPSVPTAVVAYPADGALDVGWAPVAGATGYQVTVGTSAPDVVTDLTARVGGLTDGTTYPVTVVSTDAGGDSAASAPISGTPVAATMPGTAFGLLDMEGVDTHSSYGTTPYADVAQTEHLLGELGVLHVRDSLAYGASGPQKSQLAFYNALRAQGIGVDLILSPNGSTGDLAARLDTVASILPTAVDAIEAPNELNGSGQPDWAAQDIAYQKALYAAVKANPVLKSVPVLGPSLVNSQALLNGDQGYLALGDLSTVLDLGNIHVYPGGRTPTWDMDASLAAERSVSGDSTVWVTETGYHDAVDLPGNFSVSDAAAATYLPRLLLDWHQLGVGRVNLYELYDEQADPGLTDYQDHFGLVGLDGTPKAQFTALQDFNGLLADTSASFVTTPLTYQVSSGSTKVSSMLLEKSTGEYVLFLWQDVSVSDTSTDPPTPVVVPPTPVTVTLGAPVASITRYRPSLSAAAQSSVTSTATVTVGLQGDATALVIQP